MQYGQTGKHHRGVAGSQWKKRAQKTKRTFKPNLHATRLQVQGEWVKLKLCTKCLRKLKTKSEDVMKPKAGAGESALA